MWIFRRIMFLAGLLIIIVGCDLLLGLQVVSEPVLSPFPGTYDDIISVSLESETDGATIRYTLDGSSPSRTHGYLYSEAFDLHENTSVHAIAYKEGYTPSSVVEGSYTISSSPVSNPSFSISEGTYQDRQLVEIESLTENTIICYTLDGSDPTPVSGNIYSSALNIYSPCTLKAIAYKVGYQESEIASASYDIIFQVGSVGPGGGYVFFDKGSHNKDVGTYDLSTGTWTKTGEAEITWRFLEAAPSSSEAAGNNWGGTGISVTADQSVLGGGWLNTLYIISELGDIDPEQQRSDYAARYAYSVEIGNDANIANGWYLPSLAELELLYETWCEGALGEFVDDLYWSSTSLQDETAYTVDFYSGLKPMSRRYEYHRVRAIRAF